MVAGNAGTYSAFSALLHVSSRITAVTPITQRLGFDDRLALAMSVVHSEVSRYSYPLFALDRRGRPDLYASCVLVECDTMPVLVTAEHAIIEMRKASEGIHIGIDAVRALSRPFVLSSDCGCAALDIAAMVCPPELLTLGVMEILPAERTTVGRHPPDMYFRCLHGYPCTKNTQSKRLDADTRTFTRFGFTYGGASRAIRVDYAKLGKDPGLHVALEYQLQGENDKREVGPPPRPKGMSGGGSWMIVDSLGANKPYLEGIAIEYHRSDHVVFATRIERVIDFVEKFIVGATTTANQRMHMDLRKRSPAGSGR